MKYDSNQFAKEIASLTYNKDIAFQQYHKICGAIEMVEAMQKTALETEKEVQAEKEKLESEAQENGAEPDPVAKKGSRRKKVLQPVPVSESESESCPEMD